MKDELMKDLRDLIEQMTEDYLRYKAIPLDKLTHIENAIIHEKSRTLVALQDVALKHILKT